jgi:hypothetical protein
MAGKAAATIDVLPAEPGEALSAVRAGGAAPGAAVDGEAGAADAGAGIPRRQGPQALRRLQAGAGGARAVVAGGQGPRYTRSTRRARRCACCLAGTVRAQQEPVGTRTTDRARQEAEPSAVLRALLDEGAVLPPGALRGGARASRGGAPGQRSIVSGRCSTYRARACAGGRTVRNPGRRPGGWSSRGGRPHRGRVVDR